MYKILLVDDEEFVLNGMTKLLRTLPESYDLPISEIRTAQNGLEALDIMDSYVPNVIFTDIKMPEMDGIELIERMTAKSADCKIVILSGYDNFEYAQKAIANNIRAYLLKPVTRRDLVNALEKVFEELVAEKDNADYIRKLEEQLVSNLPLLREKFFLDLANGSYQREIAELLELDLTVQNYQIALVAADSFRSNDFSQISLEKNKQLALLQLSNQLQKSIAPVVKCNIFHLHHRICVLISLAEGQNNIFLEKIFKSFQAQTDALCGITCSIGISRPFREISDFSIYLEEAYAALKQRLLLGHQALVFYQDFFPWQKQQHTALLYEENNKVKYQIYHALKAGQKDQTLALLAGYKTALSHAKGCDLTLIRTISSDLITVFMVFAFEQGIDTTQLLYDHCSPNEAVLVTGNLDDIFAILTYITDKLFHCLSQKSQVESALVVNKIKAYVWAHISEDITLEKLSDVVFLTPNYIGALFKREAGIAFKDYLLEMKISKAKELLQSNHYKIQDVAEAVGYHSTTYFSKVFKRSTGIYPSDWRKNNLHLLDSPDAPTGFPFVP